jgi:NTE family protein
MTATPYATSIGLVLAGGGSRGAYQIGVWQALRELQIPLDAVVGVSIGAINAAMISLGSYEAALSTWRTLRAQDLFTLPEPLPCPENLFDRHNLRLLARLAITERGLNTTPLRELLVHYIDEDAVRASPIRFGLLTYSLTERKPLPLFIDEIPDGRLIDYIMASACLPIFQAVRIDGQRFMDGAIYNVKPTDMLIRHGCTTVIEVEVGGLGVTRTCDPGPVEIISIKPAHSLGGGLDLTEDKVADHIHMGYCDAIEILAGRSFTWPGPSSYAP